MYTTIFATLFFVAILLVVICLREIEKLDEELSMEKDSRKFWLNRAKQESDMVDILEKDISILEEELDETRDDVDDYHMTLKNLGYELNDKFEWVKKTKSKKKI
jgi:DNA-binding winged helix-turn-helix (wHTH) protein